MKKSKITNEKLLVTNMILTGVTAILYMLKVNFVSVAIMTISAEEKYDMMQSAQNVAKGIGIRGIIIVVLYVALSLINYYASIKKSRKGLIAITIIMILALIFFILALISDFM